MTRAAWELLEMFLNRQSITLQDLGPRVQEALAAAPDLLVIINTEGEVRHSAVVRVMDELRDSGVARLAIAVKPDRNP